MSVAFVQSAGNRGKSVSSVAVTLGTVTTGDALIVAIYTDTLATVTITDTGGNTYVQCGGAYFVDGLGNQISTWIATNVTGHVSPYTITVTLSIVSECVVGTAEFSGVGGVGVTIGAPTSSHATSTSPSTGAVGSAGDLVFAAVGYLGLSTVSSGGGSWVTGYSISGTGTDCGTLDEYQTSVGGAVTPTWSLSVSENWLAMAVNITPATSSTPTFVPDDTPAALHPLPGRRLFRTDDGLVPQAPAAAGAVPFVPDDTPVICRRPRRLIPQPAADYPFQPVAAAVAVPFIETPSVIPVRRRQQIPSADDGTPRPYHPGALTIFYPFWLFDE